jgi:hypothetical protein
VRPKRGRSLGRPFFGRARTLGLAAAKARLESLKSLAGEGPAKKGPPRKASQERLVKKGSPRKRRMPCRGRREGSLRSRASLAQLRSCESPARALRELRESPLRSLPGHGPKAAKPPSRAASSGRAPEGARPRLRSAYSLVSFGRYVKISGESLKGAFKKAKKPLKVAERGQRGRKRQKKRFRPESRLSRLTQSSTFQDL